MENSHNILRYWRVCLIDSEHTYPLSNSKDGKLDAFEIEKNKRQKIEKWLGVEACRSFNLSTEEYPIEVVFDDVKKGTLRDVVISKIVTRYITILDPTGKDKDKIKEARRLVSWLKANQEETASEPGQDPEDDSLNILIGLYKYKQPIENQYLKNCRIPQEIVPLWIPAKVCRDGTLIPNNEKNPFVPREFLDPQINGDEALVGSVEQIDKYIHDHYSEEIYDSWKNLFEYSNNYLDAARKGYEEIEYQKEESAIILIDPKDGTPSKHILKHMDYYNNNNIPELMKRYCTSRSIQNNGESHVSNTPPNGRKYHVGQMTNEYSLFPTQRKAVHHALTLEDGKILAINGPPGTGKTTLIHSIIASMWVMAAYHGNEPPVMVISSANNQAVTNAIDSFARVLKPNENSFFNRWLPLVKNYGLYMLSDSKLKGKNGEKIKEQYHYVNFQNNGFPTHIEKETYITEAEIYFLNQFKKQYKEMPSNIDEAIAFLHHKIRRKVDEIQAPVKEYQQLQITYVKLQEEFQTNNNDLDTAKITWEERIDQKVKKLTVDINNTEKSIIEYKRQKEEIDYLKREFQRECSPSLRKKSFLENLIKRLLYNKPLSDKYYKDFFIQYNMERYCPGVEAWDKTCFTETKSLEIFDNILKRITANLTELEKEQGETINKIKIHRNRKEQIEKLYNNYCKRIREFNNNYPEIGSFDFGWDKCLDTKERFEAFILATHYWEARWLKDTKKLIADGELENKRNSQSEENKKHRFRRYAMLTPGLVSTLYMLPTFISYFVGREIPLTNYIDLLIIDEAGQVTPEVASVAFGLAKKAVVLGDVKQLEPIWSIHENIDIGNLLKNNVLTNKDEFPLFKETYRVSSSGSVMGIARNVCEIMDENGKGIFLAQHTRCEEEIIAICNELAYGGKIDPCKKSKFIKDSLPPLVYYHVEGGSKRIGKSRYNEKEIATIIEWLDKYKDKIQQVYSNGEKKEIQDIIAIVTPFALQARKIKEQLPAVLSEVIVGTVHSLQGAEKELIVFSTVYTSKDSSMMMLNSKPNLINVAVSRAKKSFIIFGDSNILNPDNQAPTGVLGRHILKDDFNLETISDWALDNVEY